MSSSDVRTQDTRRPRFFLTPMRPRDPEQPHRAATVLELFFDLVFVVAVSTAGVQLHHALTEGHAGKGIGLYLMVFFTIWWAWMTFTWFATSFDSDDWLYRLSTFVQMAGVLVLTAGIGDVFEDRNFSIMAIGYVIMRVAMGAQWLRASRAKGQEGRSALTYAIGILSAQVLWVISAVVTSGRIPLWIFVVFVIVELSVPLVAEVTGGTPWHREHIAERYGLFTMIVLGESLLGSANAIIEALDEGEHIGQLIDVSIMTIVISAGIWWIYFYPRHTERLSNSSILLSVRWGYAHYLIFASAGAFSAGIEALVDYVTGSSELSYVAVSLAVTVPVAVFILAIWAVAYPGTPRLVRTVIPIGAVVTVASTWVPVPVAGVAVVIVAMVVVLVCNPVDGDDDTEHEHEADERAAGEQEVDEVRS